MDIDQIRVRVLEAISPLKPASPDHKALFAASRRTDGGRSLPPYYLVYFLLVDLLHFPHSGQGEKVAWSVPVELSGKLFIVEHRKMGLGVFATNLPDEETEAAEITRLIKRGVRLAKPYFEWRAEEAVKESKLNVINKSSELFDRFDFFAESYSAKRDEAEARKHERLETPHGRGKRVSYPAFSLQKEAKWLALGAVESFFSWTEHVFILIAILQGRCSRGDEVATLAEADWATKFKAIFDITDKTTKAFYDDLVVIRQQLRNFVAHGSFGKQREAFHYHSGAGAVPVRLPDASGSAYRFGVGVDYVDDSAIALLHRFVAHLWTGDRAPARIYIQDYGLPLILTMAQDGTYAHAMSSVEEMESFTRYLGELMDRSANMDF